MKNKHKNDDQLTELSEQWKCRFEASKISGGTAPMKANLAGKPCN